MGVDTVRKGENGHRIQAYIQYVFKFHKIQKIYINYAFLLLYFDFLKLFLSDVLKCYFICLFNCFNS